MLEHNEDLREYLARTALGFEEAEGRDFVLL